MEGMIIQEGIKLYHGSYTIVKRPDLSKCMNGKDFGKGFYLTTDVYQARRFVKTAIGKAVKNGVEGIDSAKGYVSVFELRKLDGLIVHEFVNADSDWLHCVASHRRQGILADEIFKWQKYDLIAGKIANDNTNQVITAYINGTYGAVGSDSADRFAIGLLMPERLTDQVCIRTKTAIDRIKFIDVEEYEF